MRYWIIVLVFVLASCAGVVSYRFSGGTIPGKTFSYNNFPNNANTIYPNLSIEFQDQLRKKMLSESSLSFVQGKGDAHFEGNITKYEVSAVAGTGNNLSEKNRLTISVQVKYTNSFPDPKIEKETTYTDYEDFDADTDFSSLEDELAKKIVDKLVIKIYNDILIGF